MAYTINNSDYCETEFRNRHNRKTSHPYIIDQMEDRVNVMTCHFEDVLEESDSCALSA